MSLVFFLARPFCSLFEGAHSSAPIIIFLERSFFSCHGRWCAHDAHIIFLFTPIVMVSVLTPRFLLRAHRCSLFAVRCLILAVLAARFSLIGYYFT